MAAYNSTNPDRRAQVLYDGACPFCLKSVDLLRRLDWDKNLDYVDMRQPAHPALQGLATDSDAFLEQMHVLPPGENHLLDGFEAVRWITWRLPAAFWLTPFLYLPGVPALGQRLYLWIARNRFRLVPCHHGVCAIQKKQGTAAVGS